MTPTPLSETFSKTFSPPTHRHMLFSATEQAAGGEDGEGKDSSSTDPTFINNLGFADPYGSTSKAVNALFTAGER